MNGIKAPNPYCETTEWGWTIDPYGFKHYLQEFYHRYQLPILILENGMGARDEKIPMIQLMIRTELIIWLHILRVCKKLLKRVRNYWLSYMVRNRSLFNA